MPITLTRTVLAVLIPGGIALIAWILLFLIQIDTESANSFYHSYTIPINLCFFAATVIVGTVLEGINTHIEVLWDKEREEEYLVIENWYAYLSCTPNKEPVAFQYISRLVTTMYYELGMMFAGVSFGVGVSAIICKLKPEHFQCYAILVLTLSWASIMYFYWQAKKTHEVLCKTRKELVGRLKC